MFTGSHIITLYGKKSIIYKLTFKLLCENNRGKNEKRDVKKVASNNNG